MFNHLSTLTRTALTALRNLSDVDLQNDVEELPRKMMEVTENEI